MTEISLDDRMTAAEAAIRMNVSLDFVYKLIYVHKLEAIKRAGRWLVSKTDVERRLAARLTRLEPRPEGVPPE